MIGQDSNSTTLADKPVSQAGRLVCHSLRRRLLTLLAVSMVVGTGWLFWPARPNLAGFDPAAMAQLETAMWRDYYSQHWLALLGHTWRASHQQYGFSRWDSLRLAWHAARAARAFQHDTNDPAALSAMTDYYRVVAPAASATFDARKGAVWEVQVAGTSRICPASRVGRHDCCADRFDLREECRQSATRGRGAGGGDGVSR